MEIFVIAENQTESSFRNAMTAPGVTGALIKLQLSSIWTNTTLNFSSLDSYLAAMPVDTKIHFALLPTSSPMVPPYKTIPLNITLYNIVQYPIIWDENYMKTYQTVIDSLLTYCTNNNLFQSNRIDGWRITNTNSCPNDDRWGFKATNIVDGKTQRYDSQWAFVGYNQKKALAATKAYTTYLKSCFPNSYFTFFPNHDLININFIGREVPTFSDGGVFEETIFRCIVYGTESNKVGIVQTASNSFDKFTTSIANINGNDIIMQMPKTDSSVPNQTVIDLYNSAAALNPRRIEIYENQTFVLTT